MSYHPAEYVIDDSELPRRDTSIDEEESLTPTGTSRTITITRRPSETTGAVSVNDAPPSPRGGDKDWLLEDKLVFTNNAWRSWVPSAVASVICVAVAGGFMALFTFERAWYLSLTLVTFGLIFAWKARRETYIFDNNTNLFTFQRRQLCGSVLMKIPFHDIKEVKIAESTDTQGTHFTLSLCSRTII